MNVKRHLDSRRPTSDGRYFDKRRIKRFVSFMALIAISASLAACTPWGPSGGSAGRQGTPQPGQAGQSTPSQGNPSQPAGGDSTAGTVPGEASAQTIHKIMDLARQGKIVNAPFVAGKTTLDEVEKAWGQPDSMDYVAAAKGRYATYGQKGVTLGVNKGDQVFELRSSDAAVRQLTLADIKTILGTPDVERPLNGQTLVGYTAGPDYKLEFVVPQGTNPQVDHVNVLYPRGTVNSMAGDPGREW